MFHRHRHLGLDKAVSDAVYAEVVLGGTLEVVLEVGGGRRNQIKI